MNPVTNNFGMAGMAQKLPVNFGVQSSASYFQPVPRPNSASPPLPTASQASSASSNSSEGTNKTQAKRSKTSFEKNCFSAWASTLNMGLINKVDMVCLSPVGYGV